MCGRFYLTEIPVNTWQALGISTSEHLSYKNYNITPSQAIPVVLEDSGQRQLEFSAWGLLPHWAKSKQMKPMINARAETADKKPYFRSAFKHHRCLIPASGFYEWNRDGKTSIPHVIALPGNELMVFAGLFERDEDNNTNCAILTIDSNKQMRAVHNRMPVILTSDQYSHWLVEGNKDLLVPYKGDLAIWHVSTRVNSPKNNDSKLLESLSCHP